MSHGSLSLSGVRRGACAGALVLLGAVWGLAAHAQSGDRSAAGAAGKAGASWTMPRTRDGHPDFEGIWTNKSVTPFERPKSLGDKAFFTPEEAKKYTEQALARSNKDRRGGGVRDVLNAYNAFWWDSGTKVLDLETRCISLGTVVPMLPTAYNNNYQIVQSPGVVAIDTEMVHDVRRIPTDGSPHLPSDVREWFGDPRGHWEGDTLVVDSTNFNGQMYGRLRPADKNLHVIERFKLVGPDMLLYQFTVDDPTVYTQPWSGEIPLTRISGLLYEYACHEGNIGLRDIIRAAREDERKAAEKTASAAD
jgi:hypothetical protein